MRIHVFIALKAFICSEEYVSDALNIVKNATELNVRNALKGFILIKVSVSVAKKTAKHVKQKTYALFVSLLWCLGKMDAARQDVMHA